MKYYCKCNGERAGKNCTFANQTDLDKATDHNFQLAKLYNPISLAGNHEYDMQFLGLVTT